MTIPAQFRDGPLAGQVLDVDLEQHNFTHHKTGAEYVRITEWDAERRELVSYFVMRANIRQGAIRWTHKTEDWNAKAE